MSALQFTESGAYKDDNEQNNDKIQCVIITKSGVDYKYDI